MYKSSVSITLNFKLLLFLATNLSPVYYIFSSFLRKLSIELKMHCMSINGSINWEFSILLLMLFSSLFNKDIIITNSFICWNEKSKIISVHLIIKSWQTDTLLLKWSISAVQRSDSVSSNSKRKISSISASDTSEHEATETEAVPGKLQYWSSSCNSSKFVLVPSLEIPEGGEGTYHAEETIEDDPNLEVIIMTKNKSIMRVFFLKVNFPWLKAVAELVNSFNLDCTHQTFCHPACYRCLMSNKRFFKSYWIFTLQETDKSGKKADANCEDNVRGEKWIHWGHFHGRSWYWCKFCLWYNIKYYISELSGWS